MLCKCGGSYHETCDEKVHYLGVFEDFLLQVYRVLERRDAQKGLGRDLLHVSEDCLHQINHFADHFNHAFVHLYRVKRLFHLLIRERKLFVKLINNHYLIWFCVVSEYLHDYINGSCNNLFCKWFNLALKQADNHV